MCGIAGIATRDGLRSGDRRLVDRMLSAVAHRGPDDQWVSGDSRAIIGARRLAIIDLDTGRQPLSNEDDTIHVSQNGEIYNYVELQHDLVKRGHHLATKGDTETIVHLYEEYGLRFVDHLRGMFAIAIWDAPRRRLVLARDRLGKKPLYWRRAGDRLLYGSELKTLMEDPDLQARVDRTALARFLQYQYVPAPSSMLEGVHKLPPASTLVWEGGDPVIERYWVPTYEPKVRTPPGEDRAEALELIRDAVRIRLRSDVPVGAFLSGGMDSSLVVALMAEASALPVRTYSIGFDERAYDELPYARSIARAFGTDHVEEIVRLDAIELLPELADHYDEPFGDPSAIPTFRVAQLAARDLKVVLTGDGGDEMFGGYDRYRLAMAMDRMAVLPGALRRGIARTAQATLRLAPGGYRIRRRAESWSRLAVMSSAERYMYLMSIIKPPTRARLLGDAQLADQDGYLMDILGVDRRGGLDGLLRTDTLTYLPEDLLVKMDRATMANSLEARAPLLDHLVVEFAARLPMSRKIQRGRTKVLLREIAEPLLPAGHLDRRKMGFGVPIDSWFRAALGERYRELVLAPDAVIRDHLDQRAASDLLDEHHAGTVDHGHELWLLLMFETWARRWLSRAVVV